MPVFSSISFAVIGDQQYAVLRIRSSLVQTISPLYTARASTRGMTANRCRTSIAGYGVTGAFAGSGAGRRGGTRRSEEHTAELQSLAYLVCRLLLGKKK